MSTVDLEELEELARQSCGKIQKPVGVSNFVYFAGCLLTFWKTPTKERSEHCVTLLKDTNTSRALWSSMLSSPFIVSNILLILYIGLLDGRPADISVCGYTLRNPDWVNFISLALAFSIANMCVGLTYRITEGEPLLHQVVLRSTAAVSGISLCGIFVVPRTVFHAHQTFVFACCISSGLLQLLVCLSHPINGFSILPYLLGSLLTVVYYNHSHEGYTFMVGEIMFIESYIYFLTAAMLPRLVASGGFKTLPWMAYVGGPSYVMLLVQQEMRQHT